MGFQPNAADTLSSGSGWWTKEQTGETVNNVMDRLSIGCNVTNAMVTDFSQPDGLCAVSGNIDSEVFVVAHGLFVLGYHGVISCRNEDFVDETSVSQ